MFSQVLPNSANPSAQSCPFRKVDMAERQFSAVARTELCVIVPPLCLTDRTGLDKLATSWRLTGLICKMGYLNVPFFQGL